MVHPRQGHGDQLPLHQTQLETRSAIKNSIPASEPLFSRFTCWQKTLLSSVDDSATNRDSFAALKTSDLTRNSLFKFPSCDSFLNPDNRDRNSYLNISGKKRALMVILKRPSLSILDTTAMIAAVAAGDEPSLASEGGCTPVLVPKATNISSGQFDCNRLSSLLTDLSVSLHGPSYSYLPIHNLNFVFSQQVNAVEALDDSEHSSSESVRRLRPLPLTPLVDTNIATGPSTMSTGTTMPSTKASSLLPPPPVRPSRRHPITVRSSKSASPSSLTSVEPKHRADDSPPVVLRRNLTPATVCLNFSLGINILQKRQAPDHNPKLGLSEPTALPPVSAGESTLPLQTDPVQSYGDMKVQEGHLRATGDIVQKQEQRIDDIGLRILEDDDELESVLSDESFCYFFERKRKLASVRAEADAALVRAETADAEIKRLQAEHISQDHEITSLKNKLQRTEEALAKADDRIAEAKLNMDEGENTKTVGESLMRKVSLLETELDSAERNLHETTDKMRQMDIKAEQFERKVQQLEKERSDYEIKVEELTVKYNSAKEELDNTLKSLDDM
ncbi:hypothetical protein BGX27_003376 [Mortierella sp. AM989]|nr:hypothetical protein BGX27_003376 [Mortierella sp. AM989]